MSSIPSQPRAETRKLIVDLVHGPLDGTTLLGDDTGQKPCVARWAESDRTVAIFRDTNDGEVGKSFSIHWDEVFRPTFKYPVYRIVEREGFRYVVSCEAIRFNSHRYLITDRLAYGNEILVRATYSHYVEAIATMTGRVVHIDLSMSRVE